MITKVKAAIFASGTGSNFQAIIEEQGLACDIVLLICDQPGAQVIEKAHAHGIKTFIADRKKYDSKITFEEAIVDQLGESQVEWVFLAGYMRIVGKALLGAYPGKIVNIHPSLLPAFPGLDAIGQAFSAQVEMSGVTVHFVDEGIDTGPIIAQESVVILPTDTIDTLQKRIQNVEHILYPKVINQLINGGLTS